MHGWGKHIGSGLDAGVDRASFELDSEAAIAKFARGTKVISISLKGSA